MRILACVDFTPMADDVIAAARALGMHAGGQVYLVHAAAPEPAFVGYDDEGGPLTRTAREDELERERQELDARVAGLRQLGIEVAEPVLRVGPTTETILAVADEIDADIIVVGRHQHSRVHDLLVGSTATAVVRRSERPVLLLPPVGDRTG